MAGEQKRADAVFEGGGVKGIALVGAIAATEAQGYVFQNVAGTSAGAIVAALVAAGYGAGELATVMKSVDYRKFMDKDFRDKIPILGAALSLGFEKGIYEGRFFEGWLRELLAAKKKRCLATCSWPDARTSRSTDTSCRSSPRTSRAESC